MWANTIVFVHKLIKDAKLLTLGGEIKQKGRKKGDCDVNNELRHSPTVKSYDYSFTAITSTSTKPFFGSVLTATAERAGNAPSN